LRAQALFHSLSFRSPPPLPAFSLNYRSVSFRRGSIWVQRTKSGRQFFNRLPVRITDHVRVDRKRDPPYQEFAADAKIA